MDARDQRRPPPPRPPPPPPRLMLELPRELAARVDAPPPPAPEKPLLLPPPRDEGEALAPRDPPSRPPPPTRSLTCEMPPRAAVWALRCSSPRPICDICERPCSAWPRNWSRDWVACALAPRLYF